MISASQLVNGIWMGTILVALGLLPVILEHLSDSLKGYSGSFLPIAIHSRWHVRNPHEAMELQPWLTAFGVMVIAASILLFLAN